MIKKLVYPSLIFLIVGCASIMKLDKDDDLKLKSDLDQKVVVEEVKETPAPAVGSSKKLETPPPLLAPEKPVKKTKKTTKQTTATTVDASVETASASIEDTEGFKGRRPVKDPFNVGEKITMEMYYNLFKITAGEMTLSTLPFVQVNGRKAYNFEIGLKTTSLFSSFYAVDDKVITYVDYDLWLPRMYTLHVKESGQLREGRSFFDFQKMKAVYEEKKVSQKKGKEEKTQEWEILPYSQNVFSVIYYMRLFAWKDNKEYSFRVAHDNENQVFKGKVVARETIKTEIGEVKAVKIKPEITVKGAFSPIGDIYIWLSDDERKIPLRIESKIKIGTIVAHILDYQPGSTAP